MTAKKNELLEALEDASPRRNARGRVYLYLFETREDGTTEKVAYPLEHERVEQWLTFTLLKVNGKSPASAALKVARDVLSELAHTFAPRSLPDSAKADALLAVVVHFVRHYQDVRREPAAMFDALVQHAEQHRILGKGDELPASADALTPMLNKLKERLKAAGVEFEAGKSDRRFIRLRGSPNAHGAGAPPPSDTLNSTEVADEKGDRHESSAPEDITAAELAAIAAAAEGGAA